MGMISSLLCVFLIMNSVGVIYSESEIYSLMHLVNVLCSVGVLLLYNGLDYVGILMIIVYVGAIGILFIFVVMMIEVCEEDFNGKLWLIISCCLCLIVILVNWKEMSNLGNYDMIKLVDSRSLVRNVGEVLYNDLVECVLVLGLILLVCLMGCIELIL